MRSGVHENENENLLTQCTTFEEDQGFHAEISDIIEDQKQLCLHMWFFEIWVKRYAWQVLD